MITNPNLCRDFVAIDVEYVGREQHICQIGMAVVRNLQITDRLSWLVQPPGNHYDESTMRTHHLTPADTADAPIFPELWPQIEPYLSQWHLWAHNAASTEEPVLQKNISLYGLTQGILQINDSRDLYRRPDCPANSGNGLEQCCMSLGIPFDHEQHHDALYDAIKCAELVIAHIEGRQPDWTNVPMSSKELRKAQQQKRILRLGEFAAYYASTSSGEEDVIAVLSSTDGSGVEQVIDVFDKGDKMPGQNTGRIDFSRLNVSADNPIHGKVVVPTGEFMISRDEIKRALDAMGATHPSSISGKTYAVVFGTKGISYRKLIALEEQEAKGHHIYRIVGDDDLQRLLYGDGKQFFNNQ